uniref:Uncharacterized protein n=1 Tax=Heterorhabditis bacteriophora TaxID=37862 RepID=A0A1I7WD15_HETBA
MRSCSNQQQFPFYANSVAFPNIYYSDPGARLVTSNVPALSEFLLIPQKTLKIYYFYSRHTKRISFSGIIRFFPIFVRFLSAVPSNSATSPLSLAWMIFIEYQFY